MAHWRPHLTLGHYGPCALTTVQNLISDPKPLRKAALDAVVRDAKDLETGPPVAGGGFRAPANLLTRRDGPPVFLYRIQTRCKTCVTQSLKFVRPHQQRLRDGDGKESERCWL